MHPGSHPLHRPIEALLARHEREPEHARQVARLALELHDALRPIHGQGARERELLECAALLHDIGWSATAPDGKGHHKASARLIRESTWETLTQREVRCVAADSVLQWVLHCQRHAGAAACRCVRRFCIHPHAHPAVGGPLH